MLDKRNTVLRRNSKHEHENFLFYFIFTRFRDDVDANIKLFHFLITQLILKYIILRERERE